MVSEAEAKEIAGNHVDQIVGGPETGYRVVGTDSYVDSHDVYVEVWRATEDRNDPDRYEVAVDEDGNITRSGWV